MKTLKQIISCNSVSRTTVTLYQCNIDEPYFIETVVEYCAKNEPYHIDTTKEHYVDYFRAQYRFLQLAMLYLS